MSRYEQYMVRRLREEEQERAGKEAYGNVDVVNSPAHYNQTGIECIDAIAAATDDGFEHYLQGNIIKYLWRYRYKKRYRRPQKSTVVPQQTDRNKGR